MQPLLKQLYRWRFREKLVRLAWGGGRCLAAVAVALAVACLADFLYDRYEDVPAWFRVGLLGIQLALAAGLAYLLVVRPWRRTPPIDDLASRAEEAIPEFDHRLVTAIQLNRPTAKTSGMSPALIAAVTREATATASRHRLTKLIDYRRVGWALAVLAPVALLWGFLFAFHAKVVTALLQRQALMDVAVPRSITLENATVGLWPSGDEVEIRYLVAGNVSRTTPGTVVVTPAGQPEDRYPLAFDSDTDDGRSVFVAKVPPSSVDFAFRARLADARTREPGRVAFEPRPAVKDVEAWEIYPEYVGTVPSGERKGRRYEASQPRGEVFGLPGSAVRVETTFQKAVRTATLVLLERGPNVTEKVAARRPMQLAADGQSAVDTFDLKPEQIAYRIELEDKNGFRNTQPPKRDLRTKPHTPPVTTVLREVLLDPATDKGPLDDYEVEGMPVTPDGRVMLAYLAESDFGVRDVSVWYRVNDEVDDRKEPLWHKLSLARTTDPGTLGKFREDLGVFEKSGESGKVELYPIPSPNPETEPGEFRAGGRYNFEVAGLKKQDGKPLEPGDRVYFYVVATDKHPDALRNEPISREGERVFQREKVVKTPREMIAWVEDKAASRDKLRRLEEQQRGVFAAPKPER